MAMPPTKTSATSFFRIILSSTLQHGKLRIPKKFVKDHGDELHEQVSFCIPSGCSWSVRIQRETDGSIWFHDGLLKFMEDNSIGNEFFLIFEYIGCSKFSVIIFELTATEIQYNCNNSSTSDVNQIHNSDIRDGIGDSQKAESGDDSIEFLGSSAGVSRETDTKCLLSETDKIRRKKQMLHRDIMAWGVNVCSTPQRRDMGCKSSRDGTSNSPRECANERTIQDDNMPFPTFKVTLKSYNIKKRILAVPNEFARVNIPHSTKLITLLDSDDNEWVVHFISSRYYFLTGGWMQFVKDKKLMEGDVCIFERIGGNEVKLKTNIYRSANGKNSKMYKDTTGFDACYGYAGDFGKERNVEAENKSLPKNVPSKFAQFLAPPDSTRLIEIEDANNNEWVVSLIHKQGNHRLSQGWRRFVREKNLMVGDVCRFDLVMGDEVKMKVSISRPVK